MCVKFGMKIAEKKRYMNWEIEKTADHVAFISSSIQNVFFQLKLFCFTFCSTVFFPYVFLEWIVSIHADTYK